MEKIDADAAAQSKIHVVYNGIGRPSESRSKKENLILFAGRIVEEKGVLEFAEACAQVLPDFPDWKAVIVGAQRHGQFGKLSKFETQIYNVIDQLGSQAEFLGHHRYAEVLQLFQRAAIVAVPSKWNEQLGRTEIEALASSSALVSSANDGLAEINKGCGIILKDVNRELLAQAFLKLIGSSVVRELIQQNCCEAFSQFDRQHVTAILDADRDKLLKP